MTSGPKHILVAVDFTPHSSAAVDEAFLLASKFAAKVHMLHVFTLQDKRESELRSRGIGALQHDEHGKLETMASARRGSGHLGEVVWCDGDPASQIVLTAKRLNADMIVVGASGRSMLTRLRLGSVAEAVTRDAGCTVLVVRPPT
ncbi:MAG: universal stress protein [Polyangiales bacterium]